VSPPRLRRWCAGTFHGCVSCTGIKEACAALLNACCCLRRTRTMRTASPGAGAVIANGVERMRDFRSSHRGRTRWHSAGLLLQGAEERFYVFYQKVRGSYFNLGTRIDLKQNEFLIQNKNEFSCLRM
jgi:hypothetical protein